jgi:RNA polymerase sigma factor (sigma-70 family)
MSGLPPYPSDDELVQRSLAGEVRAFAQLVEKHQRLVFGVALSGARDVSDAEDLTQEAFVKAWRDLPRLRERASVGSWIAGIARNLGRRWGRHAARRRKRELTAMQAARDGVPTPLDATLARETQSLVRAALGEIPVAYREALVLYYMHDRSVAEVASGLGISEELVRQRLSRGRRALQSSLELRVEGALRQLGPSRSFTATVVIAVGAETARNAVAGGPTTGAGKVVLAMKVSKVAVLGIALLIAGGIAWHFRSPVASHRPGMANKIVSAGSSSPRPEDGRSTTANIRKLASHEAREQLLQAIRIAYQQRLTARSQPSTPPRPEAPQGQPAASTDGGTSIDPDADYITEAMRGLLPVVVDCYKQASAKTPTLAGTLVVNFTIEGEPGIGGLVTESAVDPSQSEIQDLTLSECVQETIFALAIDPPINGGRVKVTYPFTFRPKT